ncbi:hypothetical protein MC885_019052 [Smutsia gigantea]|nr:hypothetical protein MC885_019052 [Smutsia gigantea]
MAGTEPSLRATCRFSGPSRCHGKTESLPRTPELLAQGPVSLRLQRSTPGLCDSLYPHPLLVKNHIV